MALVHALIGMVLILGLGAETTAGESDPLKLFDVRQEEPPPPVIESPRAEPVKAPQAAPPSPPSLQAEPSPVVAVPRELVLQAQPVLVVAPVAGTGAAPTIGSGASAGPGTGAGGAGTGTGAGGTGEGSAAAEEPATRTRRIEGHFTSRDYPREAERAGIQGTVAARLAIDNAGRISECKVRISSGNEALDQATCAIILSRFRFSPARNGRGEAVADVVEWEQVWSLQRRAGPEAAEAQCRAQADRIAERRAARAEFFGCMAALGWRR